MATEVPNIFKATKEAGVVTGGAEVLKAATKITGFTLGSSIGAAICAPLPGGVVWGAILGGLVGDKLGSLIAGKTYTEQKEENNPTAQAQTQNQGFDTGSTNPFANLSEKEQAQLAELTKQIENDPRFNIEKGQINATT